MLEGGYTRAHLQKKRLVIHFVVVFLKKKKKTQKRSLTLTSSSSSCCHFRLTVTGGRLTVFQPFSLRLLPLLKKSYFYVKSFYLKFNICKFHVNIKFLFEEKIRSSSWFFWQDAKLFFWVFLGWLTLELFKSLLIFFLVVRPSGLTPPFFLSLSLYTHGVSTAM